MVELNENALDGLVEKLVSRAKFQTAIIKLDKMGFYEKADADLMRETAAALQSQAEQIERMQHLLGHGDLDRDAENYALEQHIQKLTAENERLDANIVRLTGNPIDHRYWEGRYRDEAAENERLREALTPFAFNRARIDLDRFDGETKIEVHFPRSNPRKATPVGWVYVDHVLAARSALETQDDQK